MRYSEYMKVNLRCEVLKQQIDEEMSLISKLVEEPDYESHYAAHSETGIVYDKRILGDKVDRLNKEIAELENRLENDEQ
tara:strand:- start:1014 stop:1250 length:237 start_codon:yes stop_codon:yes gene_type:complete